MAVRWRLGHFVTGLPLHGCSWFTFQDYQQHQGRVLLLQAPGLPLKVVFIRRDPIYMRLFKYDSVKSLQPMLSLFSWVYSGSFGRAKKLADKLEKCIKILETILFYIVGLVLCPHLIYRYAKNISDTPHCNIGSSTWLAPQWLFSALSAYTGK